MSAKKSYVTCTDQFCGAGGSSLGAVACGAEVVLGLNHWKLAIETHSSNFPNTFHECTDISACDPRRYPSTDILITSPECTNHSLAKGKKRKNLGQADLWGCTQVDPAEERSRATMWDVPRFAEYHRYNLIVVENVIDACLWELFDTWLQAMHVLGYEHETVFCNAMHVHPTPQSRDRMYVVFWKRGNRKPDLAITPRSWCMQCQRDVDAVQVWKNPARKVGKYGQRNQYVYRCPVCQHVVEPYYFCAANAIDWSLQGERIGDRRRPLKDKTTERIRYGLKKFSHPFVMGTERAGTSGRTYPVRAPFPTQTGQQDKALVIPPFLIGQQGCAVARAVDCEMPTVSTAGAISLTVPPFITELRNNSTVSSVDEPLATVTAGGGHHGLVTTPPFLFNYYGERPATRAVSDPVATVSSFDNHALVVPSGGTWADATPTEREPYPTQTTRETHGVAFLPHMLVPYYGSSLPHGIDEPARAVTTHDREALVSIEDILEDCRFRMLQPHEIQAAMAFPSDYKVLGNTRDKVRQLGNAVCPPVMQMILDRCLATLGGGA